VIPKSYNSVKEKILRKKEEKVLKKKCWQADDVGLV